MILTPTLGFNKVYLRGILMENIISLETQWKTNVIIMGVEKKCRKNADAKIRPT
jgi:hypothetical protein